MNTVPIIEFRGVTKRFGKRTILDNVNLQIYEGHVTTIIGKSGTGKSVLLKHIIGLLTPDEGEVLYRGKPIHQMKRSEWDEYTGKVSYMFQSNALFDSMTVFENVALALKETTKLSRREIEKRVMARLAQEELTEAADKYPSELSGGMQKRVALSRALVTEPAIVLFDEPTTGQDPIRRNAILGMIADYQKRFGFTAILISHELPEVFFISTRIIAVDGGRIIFQGTPEEFDRFDHPFVDEFIESLEGFQEHLTGLYSRRNFKVKYQTVLSRKRPSETFGVAVFSIEDLELMEMNLGHRLTQEVIKSLGSYINKHFGAVGGFSTRQSRDLFLTVLPFSNYEESQEILEDLALDLREEGLREIRAGVALPVDECFDFAIRAGLAEGEAGQEIASVIDAAESRQKEIAQFQCELRR